MPSVHVESRTSHSRLSGSDQIESIEQRCEASDSIVPRTDQSLSAEGETTVREHLRQNGQAK